jgi:flagellar M-ring protein FliF
MQRGARLQNLADIWNGLDNRRRAVLAGATVLAFGAVLLMARMAATPQMALLYSGLDGATAGDVVAALETRGIAHEVRGDAIHVDAARRDSLRMELAAEGLPATSAKGYELLDAMTGFGTTAQMFDAAQWRAVEGELARTILGDRTVAAARVHIARGASRGFSGAPDPSASVAVTPAAGRVTGGQAQAIRHLVAAAVPGLAPASVQVVDTAHGLVGADDAEPAAQARGRAEDIRRNVERLLAARVGPGRAVVEVAVELDSETEEVSERRIDPDSRTAIATETETQSGSSSEPGGAVTVASNLPEGDGADPASASSTEESRERVNYELSETRRETRREAGDIRRLTVAVLVDAVETVAEDGTVTRSPRDEAELATLRELVAAAAGIDDGRGDVLTLHSMEFRPEPEAGALAEAGLFSGPVDLGRLLQLALAGLVALVLGLFVIRPILFSRPAPPLAALPPVALPAGDGPDLLPGHEVLPPLTVIGEARTAEEDPVARLRRLIAERRAESVEILRGWMEAGDGRG